MTLRYNSAMDTICKHDTGAAVEDVQQRLALLGILANDHVSGTFDDVTAKAVRTFCERNALDPLEEVNEKVWAVLVDATFYLGDRTLYLRMPYFHGNDVLQLQKALAALGFACGAIDGIFGAYTELALRKFQLNLGLPSDGIAGAMTYAALHNLHHSWEGKKASSANGYLGFARAADVLECNALCLFGTDEFTRSVASRMSNLALATNPASKILSADTLLVAPDESMLLVHIVLPEEEAHENVPRVSFDDEKTLALRLGSALEAAVSHPARIAVELPGAVWEDAGAGRSAQHFAIALLDALCSALSQR
ncbi:MAG: peptidoglycan-binding domain-containing protein [Raoultibacter sp.]